MLLLSATVLLFSGMAIVVGLFVESSEILLEESKFDVAIYEAVDLLAELKQAEDYEPSKLIDPDFIREVTENLSFANGGLVVRYEDEVYNYSKLPDEEEFYESLVKLHSYPNVNYDEMNEDESAFKYKNGEYAYFDYAFKVEGKEVLYFFILDVSEFSKMGSEGGQRFFQAILIILLLIMSPLLLISTNDIIKPLKILEHGVNNIKEGNLDFKLETKKKNEIGRVIKYFDVMRQELKKSIDKQVQYEDNRKELISSISHDLKTPITSIKGHVEGIRDGVANTPEKLDKYLNVIYQKSQDMDQLIDDLFLFSKLDLDRVPFEMKDVLILDLIDGVVGEMKLEWENETQKIFFDVNDSSNEPLYVNIDPQQIKRVMINLMQNCVKYMDKPKKEIRVTVSHSNDNVQIIVADNGMGINEEHLKYVFDRFYRVDESRNSDTGGTGLGLAITKQIIEQHQGHILASSVLGEGTKMIIELPKHRLNVIESKGGVELE